MCVCISLKKCRFVAKYRILFKDIPTFLGLYYRYASFITLYLVVVGITKMLKSNFL